MVKKLLITFCVIASIFLAGCFTEFSAENDAPVTVIAVTRVVTLNLGTVTIDDRILFNWKMHMLKGATGGNTTIFLVKDSGTAAVEFYHNVVGVRQDHDHIANRRWTFVGSAVAKVTIGGNLNMVIRMSSAGSRGTIDAGDAELYAMIVKSKNHNIVR